MLKKLRLKIILAIVLVAAVMLGAILGLFYTLTKQNLRTQSISMMQAIAADPFSPVQPGQEPQQVHLPYFVLQTDAFGNLVAIGSSDYDLTDRAFLRMVAAAAQASQDAIGEIPEYSLRYCRVTGSVWAESDGGVNTFFAELPVLSGHEKRQETAKKGI